MNVHLLFQFYPKDEKYISLYPNTECKDEKVIEKKKAIMERIRGLVEQGVLSDQQPVFRWSNHFDFENYFIDSVGEEEKEEVVIPLVDDFFTQ